MTSHRSPPAASDLGAQLRATAHEPDDDAASALRARLRHKMFGQGRSPDPGVPEATADPQLESPALRLPLLGWVVPAVAVVALVGMSLWLHRARVERAPAPVPTRVAFAQAHEPVSEPVSEVEPPPLDPGPGLLEAAELERDPAARSAAISAAVQAAWADPPAPRRLAATVALADRMRGSGEPLRALGLLRAILDELELLPGAAHARALLLNSLAEVYDDLGREPAAVAARAEASRLAPAAGSR